MLRAGGGALNTHFRSFPRPMGLACDGARLAVGCTTDIQEFHDVRAACLRLDERDATQAADQLAHGDDVKGGGGDDRPSSGPCLPERGRHDACFLPRMRHTTGDVQVHEMAWVGGELWFVNTAFSCLATRSERHSFVPKWRPPFVPQLRPGDACHLNGMAVRSRQVAYVTALGESPEPGSWRGDKRSGGVLIDVPSGEIVVRGLLMPHSPRWHNGRLWLLESGRGTLGTVDLAAGRYEPVAELPGFTRGLSLLGPYAFVGLSQVRETAVFSDIPLVEQLAERTCGVWVVDTRTGETVGFVRFEEGIQEIFAVEVLPGMRYPDLINDDPELIGSSFVLPDEDLAYVPREL
ncbi:MAG: TIGR03032 family protein, partial [Pirellulales bacterium]|nr:TIGR03032 family protein [Pirellulales bacterium]